MINKLKYVVTLLAVLLASSAAFQGVHQSHSLTNPKRSSFERKTLTSAFGEVSPSRPTRLFLSSRFPSPPLGFQIKWNSLLKKVKASLKPIRKSILAVCFALAIVFSHAGISEAAPSSGRAGGSFKSSPRPSMSRPYRSSGTWGYNRQPHGMLLGHPRRIVHGASGWHHGSAVAVAAPRSMTIAEITVLLTVAAVMIQGLMNNSKREMDAGPLGSGATMIALMVAMNIPDRGDPNSIMKRLRKFSLAANTSSRKGVQNLISEGKRD